jgi:hypothetical protein
LPGINDGGEVVGSHNDGNHIHGFLVAITGGPSPASTTADMILRRVDGTYAICDIGTNAILTGGKLGRGLLGRFPKTQAAVREAAEAVFP